MDFNRLTQKEWEVFINWLYQQGFTLHDITQLINEENILNMVYNFYLDYTKIMNKN